jgi:single-strand DNA-binding protein
MARGLNKVLLIGNLGRDPEMKYTPQGTPITTFTMAVTRRVKSGEDWRDETEWFRIVAWQKLAEQCNEYLRKGSKVYIEGRLQTREWQGQDGQPRQTVEVVANEMLILDSRQNGPGGPGAGAGAGNYEDRPARTGAGAYANGYDDADSDVDDIPF